MQHNFIKAAGGTIETVTRKAPEAQGPSKLEKLREKYPNAYRPWSKEEDEDLKERFLGGEDQKSLTQAFGRQSGSIRARLIKLGLIEEE